MVEKLDDLQVLSLIRVADGEVKERRAHWYTLGIPVNHYYDCDEQLNAIRELRTSRNLRAEEYLRRLPVTQVILEGPGGSGRGHGPDTPINEDDYTEKTVFPNVKGKLKRRFEYLGESAAKRILQEAISG